MADIETKTAFETDDSLYGKKTNPIPVPEKNIGIDTKHEIYNNILQQGTASQVDINQLESFSSVSQSRETIYNLLDTMAEDPTIAAVLETYAEDATETNDEGRILWCQSDDPAVGKYITFLLDTLNVDKKIYKWVYSLCKYGDCYLRLYRESEFKDGLFDDNKEEVNEEKQPLVEDVTLKVYSPKDKYAHYVEMVPNPATMFELTRFGKSYAYIQANVTSGQNNSYSSTISNSIYKYAFYKKDVDLYDPTNFVHAVLEDNSSRIPEEVNIFINDNAKLDSDEGLTYTVRRGQSLLYSSFKIWRELMLLENSLLLNRLTKSSIVRIVNVEVGDMPKENVGPHLSGIKQLIEQKSALDTGSSLNEYTNPGPMENNIYVPTHNGLGAISTQQVGGDVDVKGLSDIDYFSNKFFGSLRIPKQFFGQTDDAAGFNGGTSLSIISSRYAKMVKRIQNTIIQAITDAINLMLLDKGLDNYINKFDLHMVPPTTQEEIDRRDNTASKVQIARDIMDLLAEVENPSAKLRVLKSLLSTVISDPDVINILQDEIDRMEDLDTEESFDDMEDLDTEEGLPSSRHMPPDIDRPSEQQVSSESSVETSGEETILPNPSDLGVDFTDNNTEF